MDLCDLFHKVFGVIANSIVRSPGRINLIGEHTDYNGGFVLPAAINKSVTVLVSVRNDTEIKLYSAEYREFYQSDCENYERVSGWPAYIMGIVDQLKVRKAPIFGFNLMLSSDLPIGAGLSSSAAVECSVVFALNEIFNLSYSKIEMVQIAQKAEHEFAGVKCGIMDQFASIFGSRGFAIELNCRSLDFEYIPAQFEKYQLLLLDTGVKHSLASTEYNVRRRECEEAVCAIKNKFPEIESLCDVSEQMLYTCIPQKDVLYKRSLYIIEENLRVKRASLNLKNSEYRFFGENMYASHDGLCHLYEVSCPELDFLVDTTRLKSEVIGARMMGGGFGGCTINLVEEVYTDVLIDEMKEKYQIKFNRELSAYPITIDNGTSILQ